MARDDIFYQIIDNNFSNEEIAWTIDSVGSNPYAVEPITPNRERLLEYFSDVLDVFFAMKVAKEWAGLTTELAKVISPLMNVRPGEEMLVNGARSFLTDGQGLGVLDGSADIFGVYRALCIERWYNVPFVGDALHDFERYKIDPGLHVMVSAATINFPDGEREIIGDILVPLNHGYPELGKVIRP